MQISIANAIQVARRIGAAAAEVITTNLKMWLGFETSETLGREEVVNGDFANGTTDWSPNDSTLSVTDNVLEIKADGTGGFGLAQQTITTNSGSSYSLEIKLKKGTHNADVRVGSSSGGSQLLVGTAVSSTEFVTQKYTFTAVSSSSYIMLRAMNSTINSTAYFENLSVKELTQITPDKSGNNNVGELFTGKALEFNGSTDRVEFLSYPTSIKSVVFWYKPLVSQQFDSIIWLGGSRNGTIGIQNNQGTINCTNLLGKVIYVNGVQTESVTLYQWQRVAINFPSKTLLGLGFGRIGSNYGDCQLSDIQFYNENLSLDDIAYDYANPQNLLTDREGSSIELSDLRGYWPLSEGAGSVAYDSSGGGNNGTINGAAHEPAQPRIPQLGMMNWAKSTPVSDEVTLIPNPNNTSQDILGNAVRDRLNSFNLDGSGYAEVADDNSLNMSSGFSTSFWVKLDEGSTTTNYDFLVCKGRGINAFNSTFGFGTTYYNSQLIATIYTSAAKNQLAYSNQNATGQWVFICVTFEPNTTNGFILYIDKLTPISMTTSGTVDESHNLNVGRDSSFVTTRQSENIISDVLFYDSVLTSDEVENNYKAGLSAHTND